MASFIAACLWLIAANVAAMLPSRDGHRRAAALLAAGALPLLIWLAAENGGWAAFAFLCAGAWLLRAPVVGTARYLWRRAGPDRQMLVSCRRARQRRK